MNVQNNRFRLLNVYFLLAILTCIGNGCGSTKSPQPTIVSNNLVPSNSQKSINDRVELAKSIRATVASDPCIQDIVFGIPEDSWRCATPVSGKIPEPDQIISNDNSIDIQPTHLKTTIPFETSLSETETIQWDEAYQYLEQHVNICGPVVDSHFAASTDGQPTFLNLGKAYPEPDRFTVLIWGSNLESFPFNPDEYYLGKTICVNGKIVEYEGSYEIEARRPEQIEVK